MKNLHAALLMAGGLALAAGTAAPPAEAQVSVQFRFGTSDRPLEGRRYQTMRALSHYLDQEAWEASNQANEMVAYSPRTQRVVASIDDFAQRAADFHDRIDRYQTRPWDLPNEITTLDDSARRVNRDIRRSRTYSPVYDQWKNVLVALERMKQVLAGNEVVVPQPNRRFGDFDRDIGPFVSGFVPQPPEQRREAGNYPPPAQGNTLYGRGLDDFRNLARELDQTMGRALDNARRSGERSGLYADVQRLSDEVSSLRRGTDNEPVFTNKTSTMVQGYLAEARAIDQKLERSYASGDVRGDIQRAIDELTRMQQILGY